MRKLINPNAYILHRKKNGFEGWYFKITLNNNIFSFIVGVSKANADPHSFVQYIDSTKSQYFRFALSEFAFVKESMTIKIANNTFSLNGIRAKLVSASDRLECKLEFFDAVFFNRSPYCPSAMGPFAYLPLSCAHIVVALNIKVKGCINVNGNTIMGVGNAYIEKDYGRAFPKNYIWCHAQSPLSADGISIVFAKAWPLIFGLDGFICVFYDGVCQYNLSLYTAAKLTTDLKADSFSFHLKKKSCELSATVKFKNDEFHPLLAPEKSGMNSTVYESVSAEMELYFNTKNQEKSINLPAAFELTYFEQKVII